MSDESRTGATPPPGKRRAALLTIIALFAAALAVFGAWWWLAGQWRTTTDDAYVGGNVVAVTPLTAGTVVAIYADTTQAVAEGQVLVQLDDADARLNLDAAEAALSQAVREVRGLYASSRGSLTLVERRRADLAMAEAELARDEAMLAQAEAELKRRQELVKQQFVSAETLQLAQTARDSAKAQRDAALSAVQGGRAAIAETREQAVVSRARVDHTSLEDHPEVRAAATRVREAKLALERTRVLAPTSGQVARRAVQVGERVKPGDALIALVPLNRVWLDANFKETELPDVRIGQPAELVSDFYGGGVVFHGRVLGLAPGTGSAFALLPPQNATGNWVKIVQRVPVRIALDPAELRAHPLRVGLSMYVTIDTHDRTGPQLMQVPNSAPIAATSIYEQDLRAADALVAQIIADNLGGERSAPRARTDRPPAP